MRNRAALTLFIFFILLIIILAQNGTLGGVLSVLSTSPPGFFPVTAGPVVTARPLSFATTAPVYATSAPANNVFPTAYAPTAYMNPLYPTAYAPTYATVVSGQAAGIPVGSVASNGQCIAPNGWVGYTIQSGDTLAVIASTYNMNPNDLASANCMSNPDLIYA